MLDLICWVSQHFTDCQISFIHLDAALRGDLHDGIAHMVIVAEPRKLLILIQSVTRLEQILHYIIKQKSVAKIP